MKVAITTSPTTAPLRANSRRSARRAGLSSSSETMGIAPSVVSVMRSGPQPRIDQDIGDIGNQVQRDVDGRRHQHHALHDRVIAIEYGIHDQLAEAGYRENLFGQHRARQQR